MWGFGVSLLVIVGASSISKSAVHVVFDALDRPIETVNYTKEMIIDFTADWSSGTREPRDEHVDLSAFDEAEKQARLIVDDIRLNYNKYGKHVPMVSYGVGALPIVLMSLLALVAFCRCCVPCLPLVLSWVYWAFGVVFSLLAIVMVVLAYVFSTLCGEIAAHNERDPGLLQWYLVPFCESEFNFTEVNAQVNRTENKMSMDTCRDLLEHCDNIDVKYLFYFQTLEVLRVFSRHFPMCFQAPRETICRCKKSCAMPFLTHMLALLLFLMTILSPVSRLTRR
ncbi:hypothetical protein ERJ75_000429600 [Trypanosoma vivax]|nr:hypothetical protein ERJ75_000429600 [Trypanosoma vivax]